MTDLGPTARAPNGSAMLRVLGSLEFEGAPGRDVDPLLRQPKRAAVLAFVLLDQEGGFCHRDRLVSFFWPSSDKRRARGALRQALRFIRSSLGDDVVENRGHHAIRIRPGTLQCDALNFQALVDEGEVEKAMTLYRGPFLEGFHVDGSSEFEQWLDDRRAFFGSRAAEAAWHIAALAEQRNRPVDAAFWGKRALSLSSFDESQVRRLISLLDRVGDRSGALRAYRGLRVRLHREFDARPSPTTEALIQEVRERARTAAPPAPPHPSSRRDGADRRTSERRKDRGRWTGPERRSGDRREGERRSGRDRRGGTE